MGEQRIWVSLMIGIAGVTAVAQPGQTGGADVSKVNVVRDLEYLPGGHLVALLGTAGDVNEFDVGPNQGVSSRVQAVCDFFGPTEFSRMSSFWSTMKHDAADSPESKLLGGPVQENKDKVQKANPITYVTKNDPPFLIVHGDKDPLVPHNQSELLRDALQKAGAAVTFYTVTGGGHGGFRDPQVDVLVREFFRQHLQNR
jgi:acetyl esterase/lipase